MRHAFDIFWLFGEELFDDPTIGPELAKMGFRQQVRANYTALFRDPATAEALRGASPEVRDYLLASGFGLNHYDSGLPDTHIPAKDEGAMLDVLKRLTENLSRFDLKDKDWNGISMTEITLYAAKVQPWRGEVPTGRGSSSATPALRSASGGKARALAVWAFVIFGGLAALYLLS